MFDECYAALCSTYTITKKCDVLRLYNKRCIAANIMAQPLRSYCSSIAPITSTTDATPVEPEAVTDSTLAPVVTAKTSNRQTVHSTPTFSTKSNKDKSSTDSSSDASIGTATVDVTVNSNRCNTNTTFQTEQFLFCQVAVFGKGANLKCNDVSRG